MQRLGYTQYVAQGGDWGNAVTEQMALQTPPGLLGIHTNMAATVPDDIQRRSTLATRRPRASPRTSGTRGISSTYFYAHGLGYAQEMAGRPQTLYALEDSPVGLAAWMLDHDARSLSLIARVFDGRIRGADEGRHPRQRHAVLADEDGRLIGTPLLGEQASRSSRRRASRCRPASAPSPTRSTPPRNAGPNRPIRTSSTTTVCRRVATSPRGSSPSSSPRSCARRSDPCVEGLLNVGRAAS